MSSDLASIVDTGHDIISIKYYWCATGTILFYDYLLTLADEIKYVWSGRKSFGFWLFTLNRYFPMTYQLWQFAVSYGPPSKHKAEVCDKTSYYPALSFIYCTFLAQAVLTLRMYAVTAKNIPITAGFAIATAAQFTFGIYTLVILAKGGAGQLSHIPLDAYHACLFNQQQTLEIVYVSTSLIFDFFTFSLTLFFVARSKKAGLRVSILLRTIAEDATRYFFFIFTFQLILVLSLIFGSKSKFLQTSAFGNLVYLPVMISRLLLSLRKAVAPQRNEQLPASRNSQSTAFFARWRSAGSEEDDIPLRAYRGAQGTEY